ncbi:hypothetical protein SIO92_001122 [Burkholderia cenocepacia]|nr:hypothetical protein [Burkholderia cenocepacia]
MANKADLEKYAPSLALIISKLIENPEYSPEFLQNIEKQLPQAADHWSPCDSGVKNGVPDTSTSGRYYDLAGPLADDLSHWKFLNIGKDEYLEKIEELLDNHRSIACFKIEKGEVTLLSNALGAHFQGRINMYSNLIKNIANSFFRDASFIVPIDLDDLAKDCQIPIFSFQKKSDSHIFLLPDIDFLQYSFYEDIQWHDTDSDFSNKLHKAIFVGSTTGLDSAGSGPVTNTLANVDSNPSQRISAAKFFANAQDVVFKLPSIVQCDAPATVEYLRSFDFCSGDRISMQEQYKNRYLLSLDGNGATCSRVALALRSNSVLMKYNSDFVLYYFYWLTPWKHYIPIKDNEIVESIIMQGRNNLDFHREIQKNAHDFYKKYLTKDAIYQYTAVALNEYYGIFNRDEIYNRNIDLINNSAPTS